MCKLGPKVRAESEIYTIEGLCTISTEAWAIEIVNLAQFQL